MRWRIARLEDWVKDAERDRIPTRVTLLEKEQENHVEDLKALAAEVSGLRRAIIFSAISLTGTLAFFSLTIWAVFT